jgi:hypothetical protein
MNKEQINRKLEKLFSIRNRDASNATTHVKTAIAHRMELLGVFGVDETTERQWRHYRGVGDVGICQLVNLGLVQGEEKKEWRLNPWTGKNLR